MSGKLLVVLVVFALVGIASAAYTIEPPQELKPIPGLIVIPDNPLLFPTPLTPSPTPAGKSKIDMDNGMKQIIDPIPVETFPVEKPIIPVSSKALAVDVSYEDGGIPVLSDIMRIVGVKTGNVTIKYQGHLIAILPEGSEYIGIPIHQACVDQFEYGTNAWRDCEGAFL